MFAARLGEALGEFDLELCPPPLLCILLFFEEEADGFLCAELGYAGIVLHTESLKNFSPAEFAFAQTERAFDGLRQDYCGICHKNCLRLKNKDVRCDRSMREAILGHHAAHSAGTCAIAGWSSPTCADSPFMASLKNLTTVARETRCFFATVVNESPRRRSETIASRSTLSGARPSR